MDGCMDEWIETMDQLMKGWLHGWKDGWMNRWIDGSMNGLKDKTIEIYV